MDFINYKKVVITKEYGRSVYNRYFHSWDNAKVRVINDANEYRDTSRWKVEKTTNRFNESKGIYEFEIVLRSTDSRKEKMILSLVECYFCDD